MEENASLSCERNSTLSDSTIVTRHVLEEESGGVCKRERERGRAVGYHGIPDSLANTGGNSKKK